MPEAGEQDQQGGREIGRQAAFAQHAHDRRQRQREQEGEHDRHEEFAAEIERIDDGQQENADQRKPHEPGVDDAQRAVRGDAAGPIDFRFHVLALKQCAGENCAGPWR